SGGFSAVPGVPHQGRAGLRGRPVAAGRPRRSERGAAAYRAGGTGRHGGVRAGAVLSVAALPGGRRRVAGLPGTASAIVATGQKREISGRRRPSAGAGSTSRWWERGAGEEGGPQGGQGTPAAAQGGRRGPGHRRTAGPWALQEQRWSRARQEVRAA